jgi:hypothetical protein
MGQNCHGCQVWQEYSAPQKLLIVWKCLIVKNCKVSLRVWFFTLVVDFKQLTKLPPLISPHGLIILNSRSTNKKKSHPGFFMNYVTNSHQDPINSLRQKQIEIKEYSGSVWLIILKILGFKKRKNLLKLQTHSQVCINHFEY